jgi:hypothetical protein
MVVGVKGVESLGRLDVRDRGAMARSGGGRDGLVGACAVGVKFDPS